MALNTNIPADEIPRANASDQVVRISTLDLKSFQSIGHSLLSLVAGLVGGFVARWFYATRESVGRGDAA